MPKLKTNKAVKKRFKITAKGKVKRNRAGTSHLLSHKSPKQRRRLRSSTLVHPSEEKKVLRRIH